MKVIYCNIHLSISFTPCDLFVRLQSTVGSLFI